MGHGWVVANPDGSKAKCGGPCICAECALEQARLDPNQLALPLFNPPRSVKMQKNCLVYCGPDRCTCQEQYEF